MPTKNNPPCAARFAAADLSFDDKRQLLIAALREAEGEYTYPFVRDVFDKYFTYENYDNENTMKRNYTIADDYAVTLGEPEAVIAITNYEPLPTAKMAAVAGFAAKPTLDTEKFNVYKNSLLFQIRGTSETFHGQRNDGADLTVTSRDLAGIVQNFTQARVGLEHQATVLGRNCGVVTDVRLVNGRQLFGTVAIDKGLDRLIPPGPRKVSVEFYPNDDGTLSMPFVDLVLTPRVKDAALMSLTQFAARPAPAYSRGDIDAIHTAAERGKDNQPMSLLDRFVAFCKREGIDPETHDDATEFADNGPGAPPRGGGGGISRPNDNAAEFARMKTENETFRKKETDARAAKASAFALDLAKQGKIEAKDQDGVAKEYADVLENDAKHGTTFAKHVEARWEHAPAPHAMMLNEGVPDNANARAMAADFKVLTPEAGTEEQRAAFQKSQENKTLSQTSTGRMVLAQRARNN